jgi:hypothetical protein
MLFGGRFTDYRNTVCFNYSVSERDESDLCTNKNAIHLCGKIVIRKSVQVTQEHL